MDPVAEIKRIYLHATRATIERDLTRAIDLLRTLQTEEARERVAVYMDGLSQMRTEWTPAGDAARPVSAARRVLKGGTATR
jgi:hypothetical protein